MAGVILSLLALYNHDPEIIGDTNFPLPEGLSHETLDPLLLAETAELEILYPEPVTLETVIKAWSTARNPSWARMLLAMTEQYNPLHNYDRSETWTDEHEKTLTVSGEDSQEGTTSGTGSSSSTGSGTDTEQVAGFNDGNNWTNKDKLSKSDSATVETEDETTTTRSTDYTRTDTDEGTVTRTGRIQGNIGVTTSAQMLTGELEVRKTDLYQIIVREFVKMFCLGVY